MKGEKHMIITTDTEKAFDKLQPFHEENCLNIIKVIYERS